MRLSLALPNCMQVPAITQPWEPALSGRQIADVAVEADRLGFTRVFVPEHFLTPRPHLGLSGNHYLHASTAQGFFAGATSRIGIGTMLTLLPLHDPVVLAKAVATLDWLSGGRAQVTFGVGWLREEFDIIGVPFEERGRRADDYLAAMMALWHDEEPSYEGPYVAFTDVAFGPKPVQQPHPRIWMGGDADAVLRRVARFGDGWAPWLTKPGDLPARLDLLRASPGYDGRDLDVFYSFAAMNIGAEHVSVDAIRAEGFDVQLAVDRCAELAGYGVTETWISPPPVSGLDEYLDHLRWVAAEVAPRVADL
ncbi:MAG TPA: TIGR03619 family F420-dependent LLM class oxidoreductase [Mycobacteriales bacterium]|nr:TIGR03619 family F420-dependent LLM class oxidoreductase [Mycobacteriales bacterium]